MQKFEVYVKREDDTKLFSNLDVKGRVHVQATAADMMPFNMAELDSSPLG